MPAATAPTAIISGFDAKRRTVAAGITSNATISRTPTILMATAMIADTLSEADPANAATYEDNAHELIHRLEHQGEEIAAELGSLHDRPFIVFHDGYRYFEERFGLAAAGSAVVSPDRSPGVRRIRELREKVGELGVVCVIDEPAFDRRLVNTVIEGSSVRAGTVDPMGAAIDPGPELYFALPRNMAGAFRAA